MWMRSSSTRLCVDAEGNPVTDLTVDDFEILEDGRPQPITSFGLIDIPIERVEAPTASRGIIPDVRLNQQPEGRIDLIAIDEISRTWSDCCAFACDSSSRSSSGTNDTAAIVYVGRARLDTDRISPAIETPLLGSIDRLSGGFGATDIEQVSRGRPGRDRSRAIRETAQNITQVQAAGLGAQEGQSLAQVMDQQKQAQQTQLNQTESAALLEGEGEYLLRQRMRSLRALVEFMSGIGGRRKSIIYVTTGLGATVYEALDANCGVRSAAIEDLHGAVTAATRGNVTIYPFDPTGLTLNRNLTEQVLANSDPLTEVSQTRLGRMQDLRNLAETTGGFAIVDTSNYDEAFGRLVRENSSYYVLGFSTTTSRTDGRFHPIQIRVKRPGLQVRSRGGYLAPLRHKTPIITRASTLSPTVTDALQSLIPVSGVPIRMFVAVQAPRSRPASRSRLNWRRRPGAGRRSGRLVGDLALALRPTTADGRL